MTDGEIGMSVEETARTLSEIDPSLLLSPIDSSFIEDMFSYSLGGFYN